MSDHGVIDQAALDALSDMVGGDPAFVAEMIDAFLAETPLLLQTMQVALAEADAPELRRAAHSLKSNSATFGAGALSLICHELEDLSKVGTFDGTASLVAECLVEYGRVAAELTRARPNV